MTTETKQGNRNVAAKDAAAYMGITLRELRGLRTRRVLPFYRIGHRTVTYCQKELDDFLKKCRIAPAGESIGHVA
jgi:hypothetical protein